jgi:hypothetical protein
MVLLLSDPNVLAQFNLESVQILPPSDLTGPNAAYTIDVRHPRHCADSPVGSRGTDLQHHGQQTVGELNCIMESMPEKGLFIYLHNEEPRTC